MLITWKAKYLVDNPVIDKQHRELVNIINELYDAIKDKGDIDYAFITYKELMNYTETHFSEEEEILRKANYPDLERHIKTHQKLKAKVIELKEHFEEDKKEICLETFLFLKSWITDHILAEDTKYAPFIKDIK